MILLATLSIEPCKAYAMLVSGHREVDHTEKIIGHVAISAATTRAKTPQVVSGEAYRRAILRKRL